VDGYLPYYGKDVVKQYMYMSIGIKYSYRQLPYYLCEESLRPGYCTRGTPDTRLFRRNSGVNPISTGHPTPETRPFARVSGGCENCGQNKAKAKKVGSFAPNKSKGKSSQELSRKCLRHVCEMSVDKTFSGGFGQTFEPCQ
jgi:hypothetical protein